MDSKVYNIVGEEFQLGYRHQDVWGWKIALAFFFGEVGAGLFFISAFFGFLKGMFIGWLMVSVCKPTALFLHLGVPIRFWRAIMGLKNSWISKGLFASVLFTGFGAIHMLNLYRPFLGEGLSELVLWISIIACFWVIIYLGFVLSYSPSIALWNSGLMPVISLTYGLLGGITMTLLFGHNSFLLDMPEVLRMLKYLEFGLVLFCGVILVSFLHGAAYMSNAGRRSVILLLKERYAPWFIFFVLIVGFAMTGVLILVGPVSLGVLLAVAVAELIGDVALKLLLFKTGLYEPVLTHSHF